MNALLVVFLLVGTSLCCVALGVLGAYWAVIGFLAALNPSRPQPTLPALVPSGSTASGD